MGRAIISVASGLTRPGVSQTPGRESPTVPVAAEHESAQQRADSARHVGALIKAQAVTNKRVWIPKDDEDKGMMGLSNASGARTRGQACPASRHCCLPYQSRDQNAQRRWAG